jgi:hypothetical protein
MRARRFRAIIKKMVTGAAAMGLSALDFVLWLLGVRGHIPRYEDFRPVPQAAPAARANNIMLALAVIVAVFVVLSLAVWMTVWLAIQLI